jgi:RNA polymerase sigma-70 factor (ECF subfamily)
VRDLEELFRAYATNVYAYARRHVGPDGADDIVSEVFLVAWRRREELPETPLSWLLVTARHLVSNQRRSGRRADALWVKAVRDLWRMPAAMPPDEALIEREEYLRALQACTRPEREALLLVAWDGLPPAEAAEVAGCSTRAFTVRLSRARARLRAALGEAAEAATPRLSMVEETS